MSLSPNQAKLEANSRLCRAVQQYPCLYDQSAENYLQREACDNTWNEIAKLCEDSATSCRLRWRNIRRSFVRSVLRTPKKRIRAPKYFLHDELEFFLPYVNSGAEVGQSRESDDETGSVKTRRWSTISVTKSKPDEEIKSKERVVVGESGRKGAVDALVEQETECEVQNNVERGETEEIVGEKNGEIKNDGKMKDDAESTKRTTRRKIVEKDSEDMKAGDHKADETRPNRRSQPSRNKVVEKVDTTDETEQEAAETKPNKKGQTPKNTAGTFYISPKNSDKGTFFIRKNNVNSETEDAEADFNNASKEDNQSEVTEEANETEDSLTKQQHEPRSRFKRACKRGLDKTMMDQLRLRQKEPEVKRIRHSADRLKSLAKATLELVESIGTSRKESINQQVQTKTTPKIRILQDEATAMKVQLPTSFAASSVTQVVPANAATQLSVKPANATVMCASAVESRKAETSIIRVHQGVQCSLDPASTDDDFLSTLKPYFNDMSVRQKLHFKKKIFESLMEVFDSTVDSTDSDKAKLAATSPPALIPPQLKTVSGDEVRLVRELVAIVQAAKQTPELNLNASAGMDTVSVVTGEKRPTVSAAVSVAATIPPPPLTLRTMPTINTSLQNSAATGTKMSTALQINKSAISPNLTPSASTSTPVFATSTPIVSPLVTNQPFGQRRVIRKLVKVNDLVQGTYSIGAPGQSNATSPLKPPANGDALRRRILRIFPKNTLSNTNLENVVSSSGVGTFIVPRSTTDVTASIGSPRIKVVTTAATSSTASAPATTQNWRQFMTPVNANSLTPISIASVQNKPAITIRNVTVSGGARPVRRYSVCGALPNDIAERHTVTKFLTTTANTNGVPSAPKITIGARGSPANCVTKNHFKLPTLRTNSTITTAAGTNTTASRTVPALSVTITERNSSARTVPLTMGFNRFLRNDGQLVGTPENLQASKITSAHNTTAARPTSSNFNTASPPSAISDHFGGGVKRSLGATMISAEKRVCPAAEKSSTGVTGGEDMAGIIASDDFAELNIKSEPIDEEF